ncbi:hypothetical protein IWX77_002707 [Cryobacterium sp. CAN_C2]
MSEPVPGSVLLTAHNEFENNGDFQDAFYLEEESFEGAEVAAGDALDGGERLGVGEIVEIERFAEFMPVAFENKLPCIVSEAPVLVGEAEPAVELWVVAELFLEPGHANQDERDVGAVEAVPTHQRRRKFKTPINPCPRTGVKA